MFQVAQSELDSVEYNLCLQILPLLFLYLNLFFFLTNRNSTVATQKSTTNLFANRNTHCHFKNLEIFDKFFIISEVFPSLWHISIPLARNGLPLVIKYVLLHAPVLPDPIALAQSSPLLPNCQIKKENTININSLLYPFLYYFNQDINHLSKFIASSIQSFIILCDSRHMKL